MYDPRSHGIPPSGIWHAVDALGELRVSRFVPVFNGLYTRGFL